MSNIDSDDAPENSRSSSDTNSDKTSEACESPNLRPTPDCDENMETKNEGDNFNYLDPGQMEIKDECDSKSDASDERKEKNLTNNKNSNIQSDKEVSRSRSKSTSKDRDESVSPKKRRSRSRKESRSSSRGKSRSNSRKRSRSHSKKQRSRSRGKRHSRSHSRRKSRSCSRKRSHKRRSRSDSRKRHYRQRRSNSWSRNRRGGRRSRSRTPPDGARLHIAEIDVDTSKRDLERLFSKFGRLREVWMAHNPPCFAFIVFERLKDAEDAQRETNGEQLGRSRIRVTLARPRTRGGRFRGAYDPNMRCYQCGEIGHFSRNCTETKFGYKRPPSPVGRRARRRTSRSMSRSRSHSGRRS